MKYAIIGLAIALAVSLAGNVATGWAYLQQRDTAVAAGVEKDMATAVAGASSASVDLMLSQIERRDADLVPLVAKAAADAVARQQKAQQILASGPAVPGDDCASARIRAGAWLQGRGQQ